MLSKEAQAVIDEMLAANMKMAFGDPDTLAGIIEATRKSDPTAYQVPEDHRRRARVDEIEAFDGTRVIVYAPKDKEPSGTGLLHFHGGGFVMQMEADQAEFCIRVANELGVTCFLPVYPLAPHATTEQTYASVLSCYELFLAQGFDKTVVCGDSAGGNLAVCCCQMALQRELPQPDLLVAISPWLDLPNELEESRRAIEDQDVLIGLYGMAQIPRMWNQELIEKRACPPCALHGPVKGLPPTILTYSSTELLKYDSIEFEKLLTEAGVEVQSLVGEGLWHVFPMCQGIPECDAVTKVIFDRIAGL